MLKDEMKNMLDSAIFSAKSFVEEHYAGSADKLKSVIEEINLLYNSNDESRIRAFLTSELDKLKLSAKEKAELTKKIMTSELTELKSELTAFAGGYYKLVKGLSNINDKDPLWDIKDILRDLSGKV